MPLQRVSSLFTKRKPIYPPLTPTQQESGPSIHTRLKRLIKEAITLKASDIHFTLKDNDILVQFRVGSLMISSDRMSPSTYEQLLAYIKFHASLTLTHPKQPQSGLLKLKDATALYYTRVSILPTPHYQSLVLRLINHHHKKN